jgi:xylulokinase
VYDEHAQLAEFHTSGGVVTDAAEPARVLTPSRLFFKALDLALLSLGEEKLARVVGVSGCAQQHTSVYFTADPSFLASDAAVPLDRALSMTTWSPTWMDSSTSEECAVIEAEVGGPDAAAALCGSRICARFTGPQIAHYEFGPYARAALLSQALTSAFCGALVPPDVGDASGMNLMDISTLRWSPELMEATAKASRGKFGSAEQLRGVLGPDPVPGLSTFPVGEFFVRRFGFHPACRVVAFTGDNLSSMVAAGARCAGLVVLSFGTSDTVCGRSPRAAISPGPDFHTMADASDAAWRVGMIVWHCGSASRQAVRTRLGCDWGEFGRLLARGGAGAWTDLALELPEPELVPRTRAAGQVYASLDRRECRPGPPPEPAERGVCAVVLARVLAMRMHARRVGLWPAAARGPEDGLQQGRRRVLVTGGAAQLQGLLQLVADVFQAQVFVAGPDGQGAARGGAIRVCQALGLRDGVPGDGRQDEEPAAEPRTPAAAMDLDGLEGLLKDMEKCAATWLA